MSAPSLAEASAGSEAQSPAPESPSSPYPGLRPFEPYEAEIFFGRESHIDTLIERLKRTRFLAVFGPSGCGKSSLVRAGLVPGLELGLMAPEGADWRIAIMRPADRPFTALAEELLKSNALGEQARTEGDVFLLEAELRRGPLGLVHARQSASLPKDANLLLVVDQFEEIFRFRREQSADNSDAFVELLLRSAREPEAAIFVVITLRSDFIGNCAVFQGLPEAINESQYLTPRLTRDQCEAAVAGPARVFNGMVDPLLVNTLLNEFGTDPDQLPVLQHALMQMWTRAHATSAPGECIVLDMKHYEQLGNMAAALSAHANERYLEAERRGLASVTETLFRRLSERTEDGREVRAPSTVEEIAEIAGVDAATVMEVADLYRAPDCCFLTPPSSNPLTPDSKLDISHESLIRQWDKLAAPEVGWLQRESTMAQLFKYLCRRAAQWSRAKRVGGEPLYLEGDDLVDAKDWRSKEGRHARWTKRYVAPSADFNTQHADVVEYVRASEAHEQRELQAREAARQREAEFQRLRLADAERVTEEQRARLADRERSAHKFKLALIALATLSFGLVFVVILALQQTKRARSGELTAQARGFWDALELTSRELTTPEGNKLLELAKTEARVRQRFLELGLSEPVFARRLVKRPAEIIDAATGLSLDLRSWLRGRIVGAPIEPTTPDDIAVARGLSLLALEDPAAVRDTVELKKKKPESTPVGAGLAAAMGTMPPEHAARVAPTLTAAIKATKDANQLAALGPGLAAIAPQLPEQQLVSLNEALIAALGTFDDADAKIPSVLFRMTDVFLPTIRSSDNARQLGSVLAAIALNLPDPQLAAVADTLVAAITSSDNSRQSLALGLAEIVPKLSDAHLVRIADALIAAMTSHKDPRRSSAISTPLVAVVPRLADTHAPVIANALLAMFSAAPDFTPPRSLRSAFEVTLRKLPDDRLPRVADALIAGINATENKSQKLTLGLGLAAIAPKLPDAQLTPVADTLLTVIRLADNSDELSPLGASLAAVVPKLPEALLARFVGTLVTTIKNTTDSHRMRALGSALAAAVPELPEPQLSRTADAIMTALSKTVDSHQSRALGAALASAAPRLSRARLSRIVDGFIAPIGPSGDMRQVTAMTSAFTMFAPKLPDAEVARVASAIMAAVRSSRDRALVAPLVSRLAAIVPRLSDAQSAAAAETLVAAMKATEVREELSAFKSAFMAGAAKLPANELSRLADTLIAAIEAYKDTDQLDAFGSALAAVLAVLAGLSETQFTRVTDSLLAMMKVTTDASQLLRFRSALEAAAEKLPDAVLSPVAQALTEAIKSAEERAQIIAFASALSIVAQRLPPPQLVPIAKTLISTVKTLKDPDQVPGIGATFRAIAPKLSETDATRLADELLEAIVASEGSRQLTALGSALASVVSRIPDANRSHLATALIAAIDVKENERRLPALTSGLVAIATKVPEPQALSLAKQLLAGMTAADESREVAALGMALLALAGRPDALTECLPIVVEAMKYPSAPRPDLAQLLRKTPTAPPSDRGFTAFLLWLKDSSKVNFEMPPK